MANESRSKTFKRWTDRLIIILICGALVTAAGIGLLEKFDYRVYDALLGVHSDPKTRSEVLFVEADDDSLKEMGKWPWPRYMMGDAMLRLKEFGAASAVFDIEYLSESQVTFNQSAFDEIRRDFAGGKQIDNQLLNNVYYFFTEQVIDNDDYFGRSLQFFGNSWMTINTLNISEEDDSVKTYAKDRCLYRNFVSDPDDRIYRDNRYNDRDAIAENENYTLKENEQRSEDDQIVFTDAYEDLTHGFSPALNTFISHARGAGFTNVDIDSDGTRRRIQLLNKYPEGYAAQLTFSPLLKRLDARGIERKRHSLVIKGAKLDEDSGRQDITIPLDEHGRMLINWRHCTFAESFRHQKIVHLYYLEQDEETLYAQAGRLLEHCLLLTNNNVNDPLVSEVYNLCAKYEEILAEKEFLLSKCLGYYENGEPVDGGIPEDEYESYFAHRREYFEMVGQFIHSDVFNLAQAKLETVKHRFSAADYEAFSQIISEIQEEMTFASEDYNSLFEIIAPEYKGSFCIVGNTGSATTDLGTTPFNRRYPNVGTHANVYNTILNQDFIYPVSWIWGCVIGFIIAFGLLLFSEKRKVTSINIAGIFAIVLVTGGLAGLMGLFGIYVPMIAPVAMVLISFIVIEILHFVRSEKEKAFMKQAFSTYLNPKSVDELMAHPELLSLGGEQKRLTALFSDIKSFSSFSEQITPVKLVNVLKTYLGDMSDCILAEGGTIDKYIGDSIVSFFGAPAKVKNTAWAACVAAIRMKQAEARYNKVNVASGYIPQPLNTRIGINTGEMVVGNMGTEKKFNYTVMGNDVNLASRLEGVNKLYKSWILCSEYTWNEANTGDNIGKIVVRKFDRVRVVGIERPVQLYNILGFRNELSIEQLDAVDVFEDAMNKYLGKNFAEAEKLFRQVDQMVQGDESAIVYADRCAEYAKKGVSENWDGVLTMKTK